MTSHLLSRFRKSNRLSWTLHFGGASDALGVSILSPSRLPRIAAPHSNQIPTMNDGHHQHTVIRSKCVATLASAKSCPNNELAGCSRQATARFDRMRTWDRMWA